MGEKKYNIDIIMLSKFSKTDGGRETWLYNFLPELLKGQFIKSISIFGFRYNYEVDNSQYLRQTDKSHNNRINTFINSNNLRLPKFLLFFFSLFFSLKKINKPIPDFTIAVGGLFEIIYMLSFKRFRKGKTVVWLRTIFFHEKADRIPKFALEFFKKIESWLLHKVDIIIANGDDTKAFYLQYNLNIEVVKNAINPSVWDMQLPILNNKIKIAYIGRLSKVKGIESFFELTQSINNSEFSEFFEFHVVGEASSYMDSINSLVVAKQLFYHGSILNEDLPEFIKGIDVCVALTFVSKTLGGAGLSNALLEQMAAGKIILAWSNDAFNQILNDKNAFVVEQYSIVELKNALIAVYMDKEGALKKAEQVKIDVQPYTIQSHVKKFKQIITQY